MNRSYSRTLSGATAITTISADASQFGDILTLIAVDATQNITNGSNLKLLANWAAAEAGDFITLVCNGTDWYEVTRRHTPVDGAVTTAKLADNAITPGSKIASAFSDAYGRRLKLPGLVGPMLPLGFPQVQLTVSLTANRAHFARVVPSSDIAITKIIFLVATAAGADDAVDVGVYDASWNRLRSAGATSGKLNSQGVKTVTITSLTLSAGTVYYLALSSGTQGGTAAGLLGVTLGTSNAQGVSFFNNAAPDLLAAFLATSHPLPDPASTPGAITSPVVIGCS